MGIIWIKAEKPLISNEFAAKIGARMAMMYAPQLETGDTTQIGAAVESII